MPLGYHADCRSSGKWVKDGVCSACGQRVVLHRREPEDSDYTSETLEEDWSAHRWALASAFSRFSPIRTTERSGFPLPSRLTQAIQWGPRASLWI